MNALTITLLALISTIIISISEIYNLEIIKRYLQLFENIVNRADGVAIALLIYLGVFLWLLRWGFRRIKRLLNHYRVQFYNDRQPHIMDIFKFEDYQESSGQIEGIISKFNPLHYRIHHFNEIIGMNRKKVSRRELDSRIFTLKYRFYHIFKQDGTVFIPGGKNNRIVGEFDRFEEIVLRNLKFKNVEWMSGEQRLLRKEVSVMYLRGDLETRIKEKGTALKSFIRGKIVYVDEEKKKTEEKEKQEEEEKWYNKIVGEKTPIPIIMMYLGLLIGVAIFIASGFLSLIVFAGVEVYPATYDAFRQGEYLIYFLLLIPGSILLYLYLMSLSYLSKLI